MTTIHNNIVIEQQRDPINFGIIPLFALIAVVALVINYFWWVATAATLIGACSWIYLRLCEMAARQRKLAADADRQNQLFLAGDKRGIYGDSNEGFEQR